MALGVEQADPPPLGARPRFERKPGAPRGLLMAVLKWASTGLGWGGGLSRLRTPSAAPWDGDSTPKLPPRRHTALPASLFLLLKGWTMAIFRRLLLAAGRARAARASARARLAKFERVLPPGRLKAAGRQYSPRNARTGCSQGIGTAKRTFPALLTVHTRLPGASPSRRACGLLTTRAMERGSAVEGVGRQRPSPPSP